MYVSRADNVRSISLDQVDCLEMIIKDSLLVEIRGVQYVHCVQYVHFSPYFDHDACINASWSK